MEPPSKNPSKTTLGAFELRLFFSRRIPDPRRVLLVESGARALLDNFLPGMRQLYGDHLTIDIVTCFAGEPQGFQPQKARIYRVTDYPDAEARRKLFEELRNNGYDVIGIVCSAQPIMTKWKWALALRIPAKLFILNENGDWFWFDYSNWRIILYFVAFRAGLTGTDAVLTPLRLLVFPFTFTYLLLYAAWIHLRRKRVSV